jgi:hypothetical protein
MSQKSNYLESKVLRHILNAATFTPPSGLYLALYTSDPTEADTGTEVTGGSPAYARKAITFGTESGGTAANTGSVSMDCPTTSVTHWGIRDAATSGNLLYYGSFDVPLSTTSGTPLVFAVGDITITEK